MADTKRNAFAALLEAAINSSPKTQNDIASAIGYANPNIITMFKRGNTRVPLEKVSVLAQQINLDPGELMRSWFATYMPEALPDIETHVGMVLSSSEKSWIRGLRSAFGPVPPFNRSWAESLQQLATT